MNPLQAAASAPDQIAYERVSVQDAAKAAADPRRVYAKDWNRTRLADAAVELLAAATRAWLHALPEEVRAVELAQHFPRVANNLARLWQYPARCERYMTELLVVRRGESVRQGFPLAVARELVALSAYYTARYPALASTLAWG